MHAPTPEQKRKAVYAAFIAAARRRQLEQYLMSLPVSLENIVRYIPWTALAPKWLLPIVLVASLIRARGSFDNRSSRAGDYGGTLRRFRSRKQMTTNAGTTETLVLDPNRNKPALDNLEPVTDFGGAAGTVEPVIHVDASDAVAAGDGSWPARYGEDYSLVGTGDDPALNTGCPTFGAGDTSVTYQAGKTHEAQTTGFGDFNPTTDDVVVECVMGNVTQHIFGKRDGATGPSWGLYMSGGITITFYVFDGTTAKTASLNIDPAPFYHVVACFSVTTGFIKIWVNANAGSYIDASMVGDTSNAGKFQIGSIGRSPANLGSSRVARLTAWLGANIISTHEIDGWVHNRFADLTGQVVTGTPVGDVRARLLAARSDDTVIEKRNASGEIEFYRVGFDWPAMTQRADGVGYRTPEAVSAYTRENLPYAASIYWGATRAALSDVSQEGPFRNIVDPSAVALVPNTDTLSHSLYTVNTSWTAVEQVAMLVKPGSNTWISVNLFWTGTSHFAYVDIANDVAGATVDAAFSSITVEDGYADGYKLVLIKLAAPLTDSVQSIIYAATGDGTIDTSAGDNVTEAFRLAYFNASDESTWIRPTITGSLARTTGAEGEPAFRDPTCSFAPDPHDLTQAGWSKNLARAEYGYADGLGGWTASALIPDTSSSTVHQFGITNNDDATLAQDLGQPYTVSGETCAGDKEWLIALITGAGVPGAGYAFFQLTGAGAIGLTDDVENVAIEAISGRPGWYRWRFTYRSVDLTNAVPVLRASPSNGFTPYIGDDYTPDLYVRNVEWLPGELSFSEIDRRRRNRMLPADARVDVDLDYVDAGATAQVPFSIGDGTANNRIEPDLVGNVATGFAVANAVTEFDSTAENLLPYPLYFEGWGQTNIESLTPGQPDRFGGTDATLFVSDLGPQHALTQAVTYPSSTATLTVEVKLAFGSFPAIFLQLDTSDTWCYFDLATFSVGGSAGGITAKSITPLGDGWYECSITGNVTSGTAKIGTDVDGIGFYLYGARINSGGADLGFDRAQVASSERQVFSFSSATNAFSARSQYGELTDTLGEIPSDLDRRWLYLNQRGGQGLVDSTLYSLKISKRNDERELETYAYFDPDVTKPGDPGPLWEMEGVVETPELSYVEADYDDVGHTWPSEGGLGATLTCDAEPVKPTKDAQVALYDGTRGVRFYGSASALGAQPDITTGDVARVIEMTVVIEDTTTTKYYCAMVDGSANGFICYRAASNLYFRAGATGYTYAFVVPEPGALAHIVWIYHPTYGHAVYCNGVKGSNVALPTTPALFVGSTLTLGGYGTVATANRVASPLVSFRQWTPSALSHFGQATQTAMVRARYAQWTGQRFTEAKGVSEATTLASRAGHALMRVRPLDAAGHPTGETLWAPQGKDGPGFEQNEKGRVVYQPGKAEEQRLAYSDGFGSSWAIRGSASVADAVAGDGVVRQCAISGLGVSGNDLYIVTTGFGADGDIGIGFSVNVPIGVTGTWQVVNNYGPPTLGQWDIDMALLAGKGEQWVTRDHPAVSVVSAFVANGLGNCIFLIRAVATTLPTFTMSLITMTPSTLDPERPILTSGSTRTTAAETPMRWSDAANVPAGNELRLTSDVVWPFSVANERWASITDGTSANRIDCYVLGGSGRPLRAFISNGSVNVEGPAASAGPELKRIEVTTVSGAMRTKINDVAGPVGITAPPTGAMTDIMPSAAAFAGGPIGYGFEIQSIRVEAL
jgi:hypothetical protein